jgi:hypothetical protein
MREIVIVEEEKNGYVAIKICVHESAVEYSDCGGRRCFYIRPTPFNRKFFIKFIIYLSRVLCLSVCVTICVGTLCYSFSFSNQTDPENETEGLEREG